MQSVPIVCFCLFMVFNATLVMMALIAQVVVNQQPVWPRRPPVSIVTTKVVISNHSQGQVYSIQHYVIKFVCDRSMLCLWGFFPLNKKKNLFFFCLSSSCVLCVECCQCLRPVSCVECCQCLRPVSCVECCQCLRPVSGVECCQCLRPVSCVECCQCLLNAP